MSNESSRELIEATVHLKKLMSDVGNLNERIQTIERDSATNQIIIASIKEDNMEIKEALSKMKEEMVELRELASKWRGGIAVILALGGAFGYILSFVTSFWKIH